MTTDYKWMYQNACKQIAYLERQLDEAREYAKELRVREKIVEDARVHAVDELAKYRLAEGSAQPVAWVPPNYVKILKRNGNCTTCATQPFSDYIPLYASPLAQPINAGRARLFIRNYLIERDEAMGFSSDEDEWNESAREIFDGAFAALSHPAQPQPDNGLPNNLPVWLDHDGIELVQIDGTAYAMEHVRDALKAALSYQPQPDNAALVATDREVAMIWDALVADGWKPPATPGHAIADTVRWVLATRRDRRRHPSSPSREAGKEHVRETE